MAWQCSGTSNAGLVETMWRNGVITQPAVKEAFLRVDRADYMPEGGASHAYQDSPQFIGLGATISAPHMHAYAAEVLLPLLTGAPLTPPPSPSSSSPPAKPPRRRRVLDVGSGSGYLTRLLAELAGDDAEVVGLEHIPGLVRLGERNTRKTPEGRRMLDAGRVRFRLGDGRAGCREPSGKEEEPAAAEDGSDGGAAGWDAIHVGAAAAVMHEPLVRQLRRPGRLFIPVGAAADSQFVWIVTKDARGEVTMEQSHAVRYVPLTDAAPEFLEN
ncbi:protein-L-isoaspartate O-methyltransferase [Hypoxylon sp. FL1284]|nr:protein-L-isoaspartate O-methyltransferase [Hypoxylon sp. FL1284]